MESSDDSYYDEIPCPFRPGYCTINHKRLNKAKYRAQRVDRIGLGKRLLQGAVNASPAYFLYLAPYGCFGDKQVQSFEGQVVITTEPKNHYGGPSIWVDDRFLNTTPHILIDELMPEKLDSFMVDWQPDDEDSVE